MSLSEDKYKVCDNCHHVFVCGGMDSKICPLCEVGSLSKIDREFADIIMQEIEKNQELQSRIAELESQQRWIPIGERLPEVIITNDECNVVLVKYKEAPECGSEYQTANTAYFNQHPERYTHWKYITPPTE